MTDAESQLVHDRANRRAARRLFDRDLSQVKADLSARGIAGRIKDKAAEEVRSVTDDALELASESKGIIAGTVAALLLWLFRNPLISFTKRLFSRGKPTRVQTPKRCDDESTEEYQT